MNYLRVKKIPVEPLLLLCPSVRQGLSLGKYGGNVGGAGIMPFQGAKILNKIADNQEIEPDKNR
jgi:hypothetical protein